VPFPELALATLIFAMHARKRGWATHILPPLENSPVIPALRVSKDSEKWSVKVALDPKESPLDGVGQAESNAGKVALCAATPEMRQRFAGACRRASVPGLATDLETLIRARYGTITHETPLWAESW
jgi:hypothetical protein